MRHAILYLMFIAQSAMLGITHAEGPADYWKPLLTSPASFEEIVIKIQNSDNLPWPKLVSSESAELQGASAEKSLELATLLLDRIRKFEGNTQRDEQNSEAAASVYGALRHGLIKSGGYTNLCLAETVNRLALARLVELLINNPSSAKRIHRDLDLMADTASSAQLFVQMMESEPALQLRTKVDLTEIQPSDEKQELFKAVGLTQGQVDHQFIINEAGTSALIKHMNAGVLLERLAQTELVNKVFLPGLIDFVEHGGKYVDISSRDVRPFRVIMQGREGLYKSDLTGVSAIDVGLAESLMKVFTGEEASNIYVRIALQ